ncbi:FtsX-like permease family protein [Occultella gossypii]|uniref:ABC3 transporter permease C-terminal domain-containing protein n=1 Tax=Occultella gossypii TaxID=2800820 RepID=A0ABS7SE66_9MICO|nr:FtsX-like permease family protein [Occultella gossypii]MBZ2198193.1 hypothetical protein [Occultella gossypii]
MKAALDMWLLLRGRSAGRSDPQRLTSVLAVLAFAVTTAVVLLVVGGFAAFAERATVDVGPNSDGGFYVTLAGTATILLMVPLATLGGAAARLAVARRDERLAALRLAGATTGQVSLMTMLDAAAQALAGALIGVAGSFLLILTVLPLQFQGRSFSYAELVAPWWVYPTAVLAVTLVALLSAGASLRKVAITPLGVAARTTPNPLHWSRLVPILLFAVVFVVLWNTGLAGIIVIVMVVAGGFAMLNLLGPWVMSVVGRIVVRRTKDVATLIAARRLVDSPKTAWRSVGGIALATFIAGLAAAVAMFDPATASNSADATLYRDMATGGFLTLAIAGVVAAVSTGVMQAGRVIDQGGEYRALHLAGTDLRVMDAARLRETSIPLAAAVGVATAGALLFMVPALGYAFLTATPVLLQFVLSVAAACALVLLGTLASRRVVRTVLA